MHAIQMLFTYECPGRNLDIVGRDPSISSPTGYMLPSFGFSLLVLRIFSSWVLPVHRHPFVGPCGHFNLIWMQLPQTVNVNYVVWAMI